MKNNHRIKSKLSMILCAVIAAACVFMAYSCTENSIEKFAVSTAVYPEMSPYPKNYVLLSDDARRDALDKYYEDRRKQINQPDLDDFDFSPFTETSMNILQSCDVDNSVISPSALYLTLASIAETAAGERREEIVSFLSPDGTAETMRKISKAMWNSTYSSSGVPDCAISTSLWLSDKLHYNRETLDFLAENYYISSFYGNMSSESYSNAAADWLKGSTGGMTDVEENIFNPDTFAVMLTSVEFQASWCEEFDKNKTESGTFHSPDGDVAAEYMKRQTTDNYYFTEDFAAVRLELDGGNMWFILPDEECDEERLINDAAGMICGKKDAAESKFIKINLAIPKFDVTSELELADKIKDTVGGTIFKDGADFSTLITDALPTSFISGVTQSARLSIDEIGVSGAAYYKVDYYGAAMPPDDEVDFTLDRPFFCAVTVAKNLPVFAAYISLPLTKR
ncbi:MAG: serpin family protein [Eubacteriales bacterium]